MIGPNLIRALEELRDQETRFGRLARRYFDALSEHDPASLNLLQRICLFRVSVDAETLGSVFLGGAGREKISGRHLAFLSKHEMLMKLDLLCNMRLLESTQRPERHLRPGKGTKSNELSGKQTSATSHNMVYKIHPAVRDGFLRSLDPKILQESHSAVLVGLESSLGGLPGSQDNPGEPLILDILEEIVYHTINSKGSREGFVFYLKRIGGYRNLGLRLGNYERGFRILYAMCPPSSARLYRPPADLSLDEQATFMNEMSMFLWSLGQLDSAVSCQEQGLATRIKLNHPAYASIASQNLAMMHISMGYLSKGLREADRAERFAQACCDMKSSLDARSIKTVAYGLQGNIFEALEHMKIKNYPSRNSPSVQEAASSYAAPECVHFLCRIGRISLAQEIVAQIKKQNTNSGIGEPYKIEVCLFMESILLFEEGHYDRSAHCLLESFDWALRKEAKELLCKCIILKMRILLERCVQCLDLWNNYPQDEIRELSKLGADALKLASDCGLGIDHVECLLCKAKVFLMLGRASDALACLRTALDDGALAPSGADSPRLLAATDPECSYMWGCAEGSQLRAEALLLSAAQEQRSAELDIEKLESSHPKVQALIAEAESELYKSLEIWHALRDPESNSHFNQKGLVAERVWEELCNGILTRYPIDPIADWYHPSHEACFAGGNIQVPNYVGNIKDRLGLSPVCGTDSPSRKGDIVFVHGLGGRSHSTWMTEGEPASFWPMWLQSDTPNAGVWTLGYAADASKWQSESMPLADRGNTVLEQLYSEGLGDRPIVFIAHSMGGVVVKQLLRHAESFGVRRWQALARQVKGIAFIATPHSGANIANFAELAKHVLRTNEPVRELVAHDPRLRELHGWFLEFIRRRKVACRTYCEKREVRPELGIFGQVFKLPRGILVVDETSAEPNIQGERAIPLDEDHISIAKPSSPEADLYKSILRFIVECLPQS